ncbi:hypothetical protein [Paenibacillus sp. YPG26]|uniref:hypothetical protein n=1 Tax=Paenibacillus sp. YPG26 TaxID=2878915 RepID=UPI00203D1C6C|nr:hypothetical protein [Paenibacillus sp. YPG26]USB33373.1 hypothetical protein LDO05_00570 [Paenibacillus sp. YPG26]
MDKDAYFKNLEEIITDPIFIASSKEDIDEDISNNMWCISLEQELASQININDFVNFLSSVIDNRQNQIRALNGQNGMTFYLWFDWMASQLRFNLISNIYDKLPFWCELELLDRMEPIIEEFLAYPFLNGLPSGGYSDGSEEKPYVLKVYIKILNVE